MEFKNLPPWFYYVPLRWEPATRLIDPATLTQTQRQILWAGIQIDNPALAETLKNDQVLAELKRTFNGTVLFELDDFNRFVKAGQERKL